MDKKGVVLYDMLLACPPIFNFTFKIHTLKVPSLKVRTFRIQIIDARKINNFYITIFIDPNLLSYVKLKLPIIQKEIKNAFMVLPWLNQLTKSIHFEIFFLCVFPCCLVFFVIFCIYFFFFDNKHKIITWSKTTKKPEIFDRLSVSQEGTQGMNQSKNTSIFSKDYFQYKRYNVVNKGRKSGKKMAVVLYAVLKLLLFLILSNTFFIFFIHCVVSYKKQANFKEIILNDKKPFEGISTPLHTSRCVDDACLKMFKKRLKISENNGFKMQKNGTKNGEKFEQLKKICDLSGNTLMENDAYTFMSMKDKRLYQNALLSDKTEVDENNFIRKIIPPELTCESYLEKFIDLVQKNIFIIARLKKINGCKVDGVFAERDKTYPFFSFSEKLKHGNFSKNFNSYLSKLENFIEKIENIKTSMKKRFEIFTKKHKYNLWILGGIAQNDVEKSFDIIIKDHLTHLDNMKIITKLFQRYFNN